MQKSNYTFSITLLTVLFLSTVANITASANNSILSTITKECDKCAKHGVKDCTKKSCKKASCEKKTECTKGNKKNCKASCEDAKKKASTTTAPDYAAPQNKE